MASRRYLKKEIDYLVSEVVGDAQLCLYFSPEGKREEIIGVMEEAVEMRNDLFARIKPAEKNNRTLVRKHYAALRNDLMLRIDAMFEKLSGICKG
ncbi:MAG: hypothetical protein LBM20_06420 [Rikenellaceae bacterium]|jgi:hypothetical protein|nr:hypothetical protein [Rikenellaceae bacterium]